MAEQQTVSETLRRTAAAARKTADLAAAQGEWDEAADFEEQAIMAEHRAAGLGDQESASGEPRPASRSS